jgi:hypothetical protein
MNDTNRSDDWRSLCELASKEKDPHKLLDLISKISRALEERNRRDQTEQTSLMIDAALLTTAVGRTDSAFYSFPAQPSLNSVEYDC